MTDEIQRGADGSLLAKQIEKSERVSAWIKTSGRLVRFEESAKSVLVAASIQLTIEHHGAMVILAKSRCYASMLALLRPAYEASIWATWLLWKATDKQLLELANNRLTRGLEEMVRDLDKQRIFEDAPMLSTMKPLLKKMDGFVHGGFEQLRHRIHEASVTPKYPEQLLVDALQTADMFAIMALLEGPAIARDEQLGNRLYAEARALLNQPRQ